MGISPDLETEGQELGTETNAVRSSEETRKHRTYTSLGFRLEFGERVKRREHGTLQKKKGRL